MIALHAAIAASLGLTACAFAPRDYPRLNEVRAERAVVRGDASVARYAPGELRAADDILEQAGHARDTLDDPAVVDHLAYVAKQRLAIAREAARLREAQETMQAIPVGTRASSR
jgi:hypothetical protein